VSQIKSMKGIYEGKAAFEEGGKADFEKRRPYFSLLAKTLVERFHPESALDIGCAGGDLVHALRELGINAYGVDISEYAISHSIQGVRQYLQPVDVDSEGLPFGENSFDLVTALGVIEHLQRPDHLISETRRVLKPRGGMYILTPSPPFGERVWQIMGIQKEPRHINVHSRTFWIKAFKAQGFGYIGNLNEVEQRFAFERPIGSWWGRLLVRLGPLGKRLWLGLIPHARATFLFRLES